MKKSFLQGLLLASLLLVILTSKSEAQTSPVNQPTYKEMVGLNPTAEADIKVVADYLNSLVSGDLVKVKSSLASNYKGYGPSPNDSTNAEKTISEWTENYKTQTDRKFTSVSQTFRVLQGDLKGNWVAVWGDYTFTQNGKTVKFPLQYTARVTNGKIDSDRVYYDRMFVMESLGFKVTPPGQ